MLSFYLQLKRHFLKSTAIHDIVPSYTDIALHFNPLQIDATQLRQDLTALFSKKLPKEDLPQGKIHQLPVVYQGSDLPRLVELLQLSREEVIRIHCEPRYLVAMIGFRPFFPYLIGLDPRLATPRLERPRDRVPAGSVAIGASQTGIYPDESPGGWNIIGLSDPSLLRNISPGDTIIFQEVKSL